MADAAPAPSAVPINVSVVARIRPLGPQDGPACLSTELGGGESGGAAAVVFAGGVGTGGATSAAASSTSTLTFRFDHVHGPDATQEDIFQHCEPLVDDVLEGINGTIMAYGQTGSGKTHTLIGSLGGRAGQQDNGGAGVAPRAFRLLLERLEKQQQGHAAAGGATVSMTAVEIYAERVRCLLGGGSNLPLKQDTGANAGGVRAEGAAEVQVTANAEGLCTLLAALERALAQRAVAATDMNEASSRSHCVVTLRVLQYGGGGPAASSAGAKLCLVDLAGSERAGRTGAAGQALAEGSAINKSLSALAGVVSALASASTAWSAAASSGVGGAEGGAGEGEQQPQQQPPQHQHQHVPYRDSKLTLLLRDALGGGRSRTALVVCCSPGKRDAAETLSSLRFASRARGVKCMVAAPPTAAAGGGGGVAAEQRAEVAALRARLAAAAAAGEASASCKGKGGAALLLPWLLRCASAVVLGAYLAWEGLGVMAQ